jgi:hypothetical protein
VWSSMYGGLVPIAIQFAIVTGIFIAADWRFAKDPDGWDPTAIGETDALNDYGNLDSIANHLIGPARTTSVPYTTSLFDLGVTAFTLAIIRAIGVPDASGPFTAGPGWADLYAPVSILFAVALIGPIVTLIRPTWVAFRLAARALFDGVFIVLLLVSLSLGQWVVPTPSATPQDNMARIADGINLAIRISIGVAIVLTAVSLVLELRRLRQIRS